ncbi:hypothetical protein CONPUDRAFT_85660 [Coniophora puteana RWD-64-598 SS2]|uniref:Uncharacterized protein n=1 Tax=Coniophora puteana (strain RWD-64-598) TaxID=741705 RepID=A0A5M3M7C8_CONPW|nr:uncharacterized protein CONPUDRAFT_85660 [Coniophora puteana RWD-64-598 SS2]EIW74967.1 hypothetical protein CONPUDRAFT_85660 [Coniophora puteana RWD-64-598 SS2]
MFRYTWFVKPISWNAGGMRAGDGGPHLELAMNEVWNGLDPHRLNVWTFEPLAEIVAVREQQRLVDDFKPMRKGLYV